MNISLTPTKATQKALAMGAHPRCLDMDLDNSCEMCTMIMDVAMHDLYGHATDPQDALELILSDLKTDMRELTLQ